MQSTVQDELFFTNSLFMYYMTQNGYITSSLQTWLFLLSFFTFPNWLKTAISNKNKVLFACFQYAWAFCVSDIILS